MKQNYSEELKLSLVARYGNGGSATDVVADAHVPRSTLYSWIKMYQPLKSSVADTISYKDFKSAFEQRGKPQALTFHSDRGAQYTSMSFRRLLRMNKVVQSFSHTGKPHDNAVAEAFFSSMKKEELYRRLYKSEKDLRDSVDEYISFYNTKRPHSSLSFKTPDSFEAEYYNHIGG